MPYFYDLWWNGHTLRLEVARGGSGNSAIGVNITWFVSRIPVPESIWTSRENLVIMIKEAFSIDLGWCEKEEVRSVNVKIMCEPEIVEGK